MNKLPIRISALEENSFAKIQELFLDKEAREYEGCEYRVSNKKVIQRTSKITPTKVGQFVTLWKRNLDKETAPLTREQRFDYVIIICISGEDSGHFLFPVDILISKNIIRSLENTKSGKRGFRVYPPWDTPLNKQSTETQKWQKKYFFSSLSLDTRNLQ